MYNVSQSFLNSQRGHAAKIQITTKTNDVYNLSFNDLLSFKLQYDAAPQEQIEFGYVASSGLKFTIENRLGQWNDINFLNAELNLSLGRYITVDDVEWVPKGIYIITIAETVDGAINITAQDKMLLFDTLYKQIPYPKTIRQIIQQCCELSGVDLSLEHFKNELFTLNGAEDLSNLSCRKVLSLCCELSGCFAFMNIFGELELKWFDTENVVLEINADKIKASALLDTQLSSKGCCLRWDGIDYFSGPFTYNQIYLTEDTKLLATCSQEERQQVLESLNDHANIVYTPANFIANGNPALEIGDVIKIIDRNYKEYIVIISSLYFTENLKMQIISPKPDIFDANNKKISASKENGSIERNISSTVFVRYEKNQEYIIQSEAYQTVCQVKFSSQTNAVPMVYFNAKINVTQAGVINFFLFLDFLEKQKWLQTYTIGPQEITIAYPLLNLTNGTHFIYMKTSTTDCEFNIEIEQAVLVIQGQRLLESSDWDGTITIGVEVPLLSYIENIHNSLQVVSNDLQFNLLSDILPNLQIEFNYLSINTSHHATLISDVAFFDFYVTLIQVDTINSFVVNFSNGIETVNVNDLKNCINVSGIIGGIATQFTITDAYIDENLKTKMYVFYTENNTGYQSAGFEYTGSAENLVSYIEPTRFLDDMSKVNPI